MFYKVIRDGIVIDVLFGAAWVCLGKHGRPVHCDVRRATGVISSDGSIIYHIDGAPFLGDYMDVIVASIDEAEANALQDELDIGKEVPAEPEAGEPETGEPETTPEDTSAEEVMSAAAMRQSIIDLQAQNAMLVECILEMSEVVYGV